MRLKRPKLDPKKQAEIVARIKQEQAARQQGYRERALALFPHICGRCGREFSGANLRELTVHHKDNDHMNNPPDGSNWELLCVACHDDAHQDGDRVNHFAGYAQSAVPQQTLGHNPFEKLKDLVKDSAPKEE